MNTSIKSFKVYCLPLSKIKQEKLLNMIKEYAKFYNYSAKFQPSLPDKYHDKPKKGEVGLYGKWVKPKIIPREHIGALESFRAIDDACANFKASGNVSYMDDPNIVKFEGQSYKIIKLNEHYGIQIGSKKDGIYIPLRTGRYEKLISHLEANIGKDVGMIIYNLRDNSLSIPIKTIHEKFKKKRDIKTIIGVDLGINNTAVFSAISIDNIDEIKKSILKLRNEKIKNISTNDVPIKIVKVKVVKGFKNTFKMKQLRKVENKRRKLRKDVGNRRNNLRNHTNHYVSTELVKFTSQFENPVVIFEKGLANLVKSKNSTWSPADVKTKSEYKLNSKGIWSFDVYSNKTSILCHRCGAIGIRTPGTVYFKCPSCGLGVSSTLAGTVGQYNADVNASINIALRGLYVLYGHKDGIVEEPNVRPDDNAQEVNTPDIREAFDGKSSIRNDTIPRKDVNPVDVNTSLTSVISETISRSNLQVNEQPMVGNQESATQKTALFSSYYRGENNFRTRTEFENKTDIGEVQSQTEF